MVEFLFPTHFTTEKDYSVDNEKYFDDKNKKAEIKELLTRIAKDYCMYCGNLIVINNKNSGQIEHSVEKNNFKKGYLTNCKYNLSIACSVCNTSFKKVNIKQISVDKNYTCPKICNNICAEYQKNINDYIKVNKIILMPLGIKNTNGDYYEIVYDALTMTFKYNSVVNYSQSDIDFIKNHIERFKLNDNEFKPKDILKVCEYIIESNILPKEKSFYNIIADLFINYLANKNISGKNLINLCNIIIIQNII